MRFHLGTHEPTHLARAGVPLFVSAVRLRLRCRRSLPRAVAPWALDSGGFSALDSAGRYTTTPAEYAAEVRRWAAGVGRLEWAAVQDWMCEARVLRKTGLDVAEHQRRTVRSYLELRDLAPDLPWVPVVQGFTEAEYRRCVDLYHAAGVDLAALPLVGVGSVCRRQHVAEAERIVRQLAALGLQLHGFGFKLQGLARCADALASADSLSWSHDGRWLHYRRKRHARRRARSGDLFDVGPPPAVRSHANDLRHALAFRARVREACGRWWDEPAPTTGTPAGEIPADSGN